MIKVANQLVEPSKIMVVTEGSEKDKILRSGDEPYWYKDPNGYYVSKWKHGPAIEIVQVESIANHSIAYEYIIVGR